jgi:hypothetical protein
MAVTGVFAADFSSFDKAVQQSDANLGKLEATGGKVSASLRLMTQQQEAMLDQVGAAGGRLEELGTAAGTTSGQVTTLSQSYQQFDGMLQAAGINIGPQVKGLEDLANAAGKTAAELGTLGTIGAAAGAFALGWKFGEWIDGFLGLSKAIGASSDALLKLQTDAAKQDTINLAIRQGAKDTISYADAVKYLSDQVQVNADKKINWRAVLSDAQREVRELTAAQKDDIAVAIEAGATTAELTNKYGLSALALDILAGKQKAAAAATKEHEQGQVALDKAYDKLMSDVTNANQLAKMEADAAKLATEANNARAVSIQNIKTALSAIAGAQHAEENFLKNYEAQQAKVDAENKAMMESLNGVAKAHTDAGAAAKAGTDQTVAGYQAAQTTIELTADSLRAWLDLQRATQAANALMSSNSLFTTGSMLENLSRLGGPSSPIPGFASGVQNFEGGLARVHGGEVLANLPAGTSVFPKGSGFGGATVSNVFNLTDTESNLARRVSEMIMRQVRAGTQIGTA